MQPELQAFNIAELGEPITVMGSQCGHIAERRLLTSACDSSSIFVLTSDSVLLAART
jgi:hypothetical protein